MMLQEDVGVFRGQNFATSRRDSEANCILPGASLTAAVLGLPYDHPSFLRCSHALFEGLCSFLLISLRVSWRVMPSCAIHSECPTQLQRHWKAHCHQQTAFLNVCRCVHFNVPHPYFTRFLEALSRD